MTLVQQYDKNGIPFEWVLAGNMHDLRPVPAYRLKDITDLDAFVQNTLNQHCLFAAPGERTTCILKNGIIVAVVHYTKRCKKYPAWCSRIKDLLEA